MAHRSLSALVLLVCANGPAVAAPPTVGERHPDFALPELATGKPKSLSNYRGKKVLLIQFASW